MDEFISITHVIDNIQVYVIIYLQSHKKHWQVDREWHYFDKK